jgi:hypothetical protein
MGKEMDLHQIAIFKQQSTIFKALRRIDERLERLNNDQAVENPAPTPGASEKNFGNLVSQPDRPSRVNELLTVLCSHLTQFQF